MFCSNTAGFIKKISLYEISALSYTLLNIPEKTRFSSLK
jgi:hypothetical protein